MDDSSEINFEDSSFRDPSGNIFYQNGNVYRTVNEIYRPVYEKLISTGLLDTLIDKGLLIQTKESDIDKGSAYKVLKTEKLEFISYPVEWSFSQMKDAALLTLDVFESALTHNLILKDATAYNVQFRNGKPVFIDTLSFDFFEEGSPWIAYRQFVEHFLSPLLLYAYVGENLWYMQSPFQDGIPVEIVNKLLPWHKKLNPFVLMHVVAHAKAKTKYNDRKVDISVQKRGVFSRNYYRNLIDNLRTTINGIKWKNKTFWNDYYESNTGREYLDHKVETIGNWAKLQQYKTVWDLGGNDGTFSRIYAEKGSFVLAIDSDFSAIESLYKNNKEGGFGIYPVLMRLDNPTTSYGWFNKERKSIFQRSKPDLVLALAVIHHLVITNGIPLYKVADFFSSITDNLIIEFIPKSDPQIQRLLRNRADIFNDYSQVHFEAVFGEKYVLKLRMALNTSDRVLFYYVKK